MGVYTREADFAQYLHDVLSDMAIALGWSVEDGSYRRVVSNALLAYGVDSLSEASDVKRLNMLGEVELWRMVMAATSARYDFSADGGNYSRSQMHEMAMKRYQEASTLAIAYDPNYVVRLSRLEYVNDPYSLPEYGRRAE